MSLNQEIFLRAHTVTPVKSSQQTAQPVKWPDRIIVFDTETTIDTRQDLTFGSYRLCRLVDSEYVCSEEGLFYADDLDEHTELRAYVDDELADIELRSFPPKLELNVLPRWKFVEKVLWKAVKDGAMVVGFNLPFDLSRLAVDWARARNNGWSLVLSQRRSRKTGKIEPNPDRPRIRITAKDSKSAFISLMRPRISQEWPAARFLDLHTLAAALHSESYSLSRACSAFGVLGKLNHEPTGKISSAEINYCRQDVRASVNLLNALKKEFDLHPIEILPDRAYSPASIAKSYLKAMGIVPPKEKFRTPHRALGIAMQAYYGGRAECRIRHVQVPIVHTDFTSQYPSVNALLGNSDVLTAESLTFDDATSEIRTLLKRVTLQKAFDRRFWKQLKFFALVRPSDDIFPVRAVYNNQTRNIGVNRLTSKKPIWFAGPDVIASILLTGKIPHIEKAIRLVPHGKQRGLKSTKLRGMVTIDPQRDDFFRLVIEQRKIHKSDKSLGHFLKILANAGSYGLFVELTPEKQKKSTLIKVFSGQDSFSQPSCVLEQSGLWYFPPIAALITAGGRLLLAMLEKCVIDASGSYLFCDTDSLCIVASKEGGLVECPGGAHTNGNGQQAVEALSWECVRKIGDVFSTLNPYDAKAIPGSLLKIEHVNFDAAGRQRQLYAYAISAKRYAIYERNGKTLKIVDPKAHGLGYLYPPADRKNAEDQDWTFEVWDYLLRDALKLPRRTPSWLNLPVMMRIALTTPHVLHRLNRTTRPYNFLLCPLIDTVAGIPRGASPGHFTLITHFTRNREQWINVACTNVFDGKVYELALEQNSTLDKVIPQTFGYILRLYPYHPESKSLAPDGGPCTPTTCGLLQRASITAGRSRYVGKETDRRWEQGEDLSLTAFATREYRPSGKMNIADSATIEEMAKCSVRELIRRTGLSHHTLATIRAGRAVRQSTLAALKSNILSVQNHR